VAFDAGRVKPFGAGTPGGLALKTALGGTHNLAGDDIQRPDGVEPELDKPLPFARPAEPVDLLYFVGCVGSQYPQTFSIPQSITRYWIGRN